MTTLRHSSPLGALSIPGVLGPVEPGESFEVPEDLAAQLLEQSDLYELVDGDAIPYAEHKVAELRDLLAARGLSIAGTKPELIARLIEDDERAAASVPDEPQTITSTEPAEADTPEGEQQ